MHIKTVSDFRFLVSGARQARPMTQVDLSIASKVSQSAISKLESGVTDQLTLESFLKISKALGYEVTLKKV